MTEMENKISSVTGLVTTTMLNTKTTEIVNRIPDITIVATNVSFFNTQNEIVDKNTKYKRTKNITLGVPNLNTYQLAYSWSYFYSLISICKITVEKFQAHAIKSMCVKFCNN